MKIYTRSGDAGSTGLFGGPRVLKDDARIEAYGTVDELNAAIGMARSAGLSDSLDEPLANIQAALFSIGAELATPDPGAHQMKIISSEHVQQLEAWIDHHEQELPELKTFVLPAGSAGSTHLQLARAICRRAERRVVTLIECLRLEPSGMPAPMEVMVYLNRLSDLLFVLARVANREAGVPDMPWTPPQRDQNESQPPSS